MCIRRWDFSETSQTVSLFTREHGVIRGLAKGAKRERGTFAGGMDVLTRGQIIAIVKPGRELTTLTQWTLEEVYWPLRKSLAANRAGLYMADAVHHMLTPGAEDPHPSLFDAFTRALSRLESPETIGSVLLEFQWALLRETGYEPRLEMERPIETAEITDVYAFSPAAGGLIDEAASEHHGPLWRVRRETVALLRRLAAEAHTGDAVTDGDHFSGVDTESIHRANRLLAAYIREILGSPLPTLEWAFPDLER